MPVKQQQSARASTELGLRKRRYLRGLAVKAFGRPASVCGLLAAIAVFGITFAVAGSSGVSFAVDPVTFTLTPPIRNATVTLTNLSTDPLRLQVSVQAWTQSESGKMQLSPTSGVIVFPQLFTLLPSTAQRLRAAVVAPISTTEQTFRIVIADLPPFNDTVTAPRSRTNITVRTRFLVPLYVEPAVRTRAGRFETGAMHDEKLTFALVNTGTVHLEGLTLPIRLLDANGVALFSTDAGRWNVLAGGRRIFTVDTGKVKCVVGASLTISPGGDTLPAQTLRISACT
jgi:P pilus assembly chaperone PapD